MANVAFQFRHDLAANWTTNDPILLQNEVGLEEDTGKGKVGNSVDNWSALPYTIYMIYLSTTAPSNTDWIWIDTS